MRTILISSGYPPQTLQALAKHWHVLDIPDHAEALDHLKTSPYLPDAVAIGYVSQKTDGEDADWDRNDQRKLPAHKMLREVLEIDPDLPVIISTSVHNPAAIVHLIKDGAFDYVLETRKRNDEAALEHYTQKLIFALKRATQWRRTILENRHLKNTLDQVPDHANILARSSAMIRILDLIRKVATTPATVLVTGESGTGKELVARSIHEHSHRREQPFIAINCGALSETLLTSELFGHSKGAFTGADSHHPGLVRQAGEGTLFLDEIGTVSPEFQVMLLRVLEQRIARPVGGQADYPVRCRFLAAANQNLEDLVRKGEFREDLYYRLNVFHIHLPPLRRRPEDIPVLANHFLARTAAEYNRDIIGFEPTAMELLERYSWPGNIRQLRNSIERSVILCEGRRITASDLNLGSVERKELLEPCQDYHTAMRQFESRLIRTAMQRSEGNLSQAARLLNIKRTTLNYRIKQLELKEKTDA